MDDVAKVARGPAHFAMWVCFPSVETEPPWSRGGAVYDRQQGCLLGFGGSLAVQESADERPVRGLATPIPTIGEAAVKGGFLDLLKTSNHIVPEEGRRPVAEVELGS
jgi:hypothetical protein